MIDNLLLSIETTKHTIPTRIGLVASFEYIKTYEQNIFFCYQLITPYKRTDYEYKLIDYKYPSSEINIDSDKDKITKYRFIVDYISCSQGGGGLAIHQSIQEFSNSSLVYKIIDQNKNILKQGCILPVNLLSPK